MKNTAGEKVFYHHIDLLRFLFSVVIVYYHVLNANIIPYVTDPLYIELGNQVRYSSNIVICFFMISGLFMYRSFLANPEQSVFEFILGRVVRLWPVMALAMMAEAAISGNFRWQSMLLNGMFLQCSGLSLEHRGILWYVSSFFFATILLYTILKSFGDRIATLIISLLSYFCMVFMVNYNNGLIGGRETVLYVLNIGVLRGVAFIGVGILLAIVFEKMTTMLRIAPLSKRTDVVLFGLKIVLETCALYFLYMYFLKSIRVQNHIVLVLVFSLFLLCMISHRDPLGIVLNKKILGFPGKFAYSIYMMQGTAFLILQKTLWKNETLLSNTWLTIAVSTLIPVALGIATYYLVEKPSTDLFRKWYRKYRFAVQVQNGDKEFL